MGRMYCSIAGANSSSWNWTSSPRTPVWDVRSARAPAFGVYFNVLMASSTRRRVSGEIERFPESAYETVLRETPAALATSPKVATTFSFLAAGQVRFCAHDHDERASGPAVDSLAARGQLRSRPCRRGLAGPPRAARCVPSIRLSRSFAGIPDASDLPSGWRRNGNTGSNRFDHCCTRSGCEQGAPIDSSARETVLVLVVDVERHRTLIESNRLTR